MKQEKDELEIERRFLIRNCPFTVEPQFEPGDDQNPLGVKQLFIVQLYMPDGTRLRCEQPLHSPREYIRTLKTTIPGQLGVREQEQSITESDFLSEIKHATKIISKIRRTFMDGDVKWDIDTFQFNLSVAEAEMPSEDHVLVVPDFIQSVILTEVTGNKDLSNFSMASSTSQPVGAFRYQVSRWTLLGESLPCEPKKSVYT